MVDPTTTAIIVALSAIALVLLDAVRKTIAREEWDRAAFSGAMAVALSYSFVYLVVTYRAKWTLVANRLQLEWLVPERAPAAHGGAQGDHQTETASR